MAASKQKGTKRIQKNKACPLPSKRSRMETENNSSRSYFENFTNTPGLQHLVENIFLSLNYEDLHSCQLINHSSSNILKNPNFWLQKFVLRGLSKQNQTDWRRAIQLTRNTKLEDNVLRYLKRSLKHQKLVDLPCYIDENVVLKSSKIVRQIDMQFMQNWNDLEPGYIQMFASFSKNPNALWYHGSSPIGMAAKSGDVEFIKSLAPLTENPNQAGTNGDTPFRLATKVGRADVNKYLGSLIDIPKNITSPKSAVEQCNLRCHKFDDDNFLEIRPYLEIFMSFLADENSNTKKKLDFSKRQLMTISFVLNGMLVYIDNVLRPHVKRLSKSEKEKFEDNFAKFLKKTWQDTYGPSYLWNNQELSNEQLSKISLSLNQIYILLKNLLQKIEDNCGKSSSATICKLVETQISR